VTAHEVLIQYEGRLQELQAGLAQVRVQYLTSATVLIVAAALFLALGFLCRSTKHPILVAVTANSNCGCFGADLPAPLTRRARKGNVGWAGLHGR
jgi:hypothetical protein